MKTLFPGYVFLLCLDSSTSVRLLCVLSGYGGWHQRYQIPDTYYQRQAVGVVKVYSKR